MSAFSSYVQLTLNIYIYIYIYNVCFPLSLSIYIYIYIYIYVLKTRNLEIVFHNKFISHIKVHQINFKSIYEIYMTTFNK